MQLKDTTDDEVELTKMDGLFAASALYTSLRLLKEATELWKDVPASKAIFRRLHKKLEALPVTRLNQKIKDALGDVSDAVKFVLERQGQPKPVAAAKKPVSMLKLYEPEIEDE